MRPGLDAGRPGKREQGAGWQGRLRLLEDLRTIQEDEEHAIGDVDLNGVRALAQRGYCARVGLEDQVTAGAVGPGGDAREVRAGESRVLLRGESDREAVQLAKTKIASGAAAGVGRLARRVEQG